MGAPHEEDLTVLDGFYRPTAIDPYRRLTVAQ